MFLSSLGVCAAYYATEYLRARSLPDDGLEIHVAGEKGRQAGFGLSRCESKWSRRAPPSGTATVFCEPWTPAF
ncbi:MAG TPA: hypothetical protein VK776_18285 [Bryobacteraceae bacterium]|jgi:uncharacterized OsmC-like protein|nr:hypothetical protein [Bryobacteraceae bacterium]